MMNYKDVEGSGRGLSEANIVVYAWSDWEKQENPIPIIKVEASGIRGRCVNHTTATCSL